MKEKKQLRFYRDEVGLLRIDSCVEEFMQQLFELIAGKDAEKIVAAMEVLERVEVIMICRKVAKRLKHRDSLVRGSACNLLAFWDQREFAGAIAELLEDRDPWVRGMAAMALGDLMATEYREELIKHMEASSSVDQVHVAYSLVNFGDAEHFDKVLSGIDERFPGCTMFVLRNIITIVPPDRINDSIQIIRQFVRSTKHEDIKVLGMTALEELIKLRRKLARKKASHSKKS